MMLSERLEPYFFQHLNAARNSWQVSHMADPVSILSWTTYTIFTLVESDNTIALQSHSPEIVSTLAVVLRLSISIPLDPFLPYPSR